MNITRTTEHTPYSKLNCGIFEIDASLIDDPESLDLLRHLMQDLVVVRCERLHSDTRFGDVYRYTAISPFFAAVKPGQRIHEYDCDVTVTDGTLTAIEWRNPTVERTIKRLKGGQTTVNNTSFDAQQAKAVNLTEPSETTATRSSLLQTAANPIYSSILGPLQYKDSQ